MKTVLVVFGTRPEAIKMCPLVNELKKRREIKTLVCVSGQHREMLNSVLDCFGVVPDYDLSVMKKAQSLFDISVNIMNGIKDILADIRPDIVLVHGDTSTAFITALSCFYMNIPIGHVEAGLRSGEITDPFPEEFNRIAISLISDIDFSNP